MSLPCQCTQKSLTERISQWMGYIQWTNLSTIVVVAYFSFILFYVGAYENVCPNNIKSPLKICSVSGIDTDVKKLQPGNTTWRQIWKGFKTLFYYVEVQARLILSYLPWKGLRNNIEITSKNDPVLYFLNGEGFIIYKCNYVFFAQIT
jgi:hypothetical protein